MPSLLHQTAESSRPSQRGILLGYAPAKKMRRGSLAVWDMSSLFGDLIAAPVARWWACHAHVQF